MKFFEDKSYKNYIIIALIIALIASFFSGNSSKQEVSKPQLITDNKNQISQASYKQEVIKPQVVNDNKNQISQASYSNNLVKKSSTGICHAPGTTYYARTKNYTAFNSVQDCLDSGGRLPLR
jgi:hypothetical protein